MKATPSQNSRILEIWKDIPLHENYQASSKGRIRHGRLDNIKSASLDDRGYLRVRLSVDDSMGSNKKVHRLVAQAFLNNPRNKNQVNHKNGIKDDNRVENLEWCTNSENISHAIKNGLFHDCSQFKGENNHKSKLTEDDVRYIRSIPKGELNKVLLMSKYDICRTTLNRCLNKSYWANV